VTHFTPGFNDVEECLKGHGLHEVEVKPCLGRAGAGGVIAGRRDRHVQDSPGWRGVILKSGEQLFAVHTGHAQIEHADIGCEVAANGSGTRAVIAHRDVQSEVAEEVGCRVRNVSVVIDVENPWTPSGTHFHSPRCRGLTLFRKGRATVPDERRT